MEQSKSVQQTLANQNFESIFLTSTANIFYTTNFYTDPHERLVGVYFHEQTAPVLIVPSLEKQDAIQAGWTGDIISYQDHENPWELFYHYLEKNDTIPKTMAIEKEHMTVDRLESIQANFPNLTLHNGSQFMYDSRMIKTAEEYEILKQAAKLADYGVEIGVQAIKEGKAELEIVAEIEYQLKKQGVQEMAFSTMVLTGEKTASPHGNPSLDKIKPGDMVLFDLGVVYQGYCSDITRTVAYKYASNEQKKIYQTVLEAQEKAIKAAKLGVALGQLDQVARGHIETAGFGEYFTHRLGHGIGIDVHEFPSLTATNDLPLASGMCFTIEPGIYVPNVAGVRIEDQIFITETETKVLNRYPKTLQIIE